MKKAILIGTLLVVVLTGCGKTVEPIVSSLTEQAESREVIVEEANVEVEEPPVIVVEEPTISSVNLGTFILTAYCSCEKCCGYWATVRPLDENGEPIVYTSIGSVAQAGKTIAVDPSVIPYGSQVEINGHVYTAEDTGGAIKGNRIDVYFDDHNEALCFGRQTAEVFLLIGGK